MLYVSSLPVKSIKMAKKNKIKDTAILRKIFGVWGGITIVPFLINSLYFFDLTIIYTSAGNNAMYMISERYVT